MWRAGRGHGDREAGGAISGCDRGSAQAGECAVVVAYQVSGEYAMIEAAAERGWVDRERVVRESLGGMKRAGADLVISYFLV